MGDRILETILAYFSGIFIVGSILTLMYMTSDTRKIMLGYIECPVYATVSARDRTFIKYIWTKDCAKVMQKIEGKNGN